MDYRPCLKPTILRMGLCGQPMSKGCERRAEASCRPRNRSHQPRGPSPAPPREVSRQAHQITWNQLPLASVRVRREWLLLFHTAISCRCRVSDGSTPGCWQPICRLLYLPRFHYFTGSWVLGITEAPLAFFLLSNQSRIHVPIS
jgi:hypothetical protein